MASSLVQVQCSFFLETIRTVRDGEPRTATSTFTQLLNCGKLRLVPPLTPDRKLKKAGYKPLPMTDLSASVAMVSGRPSLMYISHSGMAWIGQMIPAILLHRISLDRSKETDTVRKHGLVR